jgi:hypothetical protein
MIHGPEAMAAHSKQMLHDAVDVQESLRMGGRSDASHVTLSLSRGLMRRVDMIVRVGSRVVGDRRNEVAVREVVAAQLIGDEPTRDLSVAPQASPK